ncbi:unnamed protein product, partial [Ixodes hexagonus]
QKDGRQRTRLSHDNAEGADKHKHPNQKQRQQVQGSRNHHHRQQERPPAPSINPAAVASLSQGHTLNSKRPHSKLQQWKPFNEASYQERLRHWEARELEMATRNAKRAEEHEQEILRRVAWAKADAKFHEEYDDNVSDSQFYKGGSLRIKRENFDKEKYVDSQDYLDEKKELSVLKSRLETGTETARVNGCSRRATFSSPFSSSQDESSRSSSCSGSSDRTYSRAVTNTSSSTGSITSNKNVNEAIRGADSSGTSSSCPSKNDRNAPRESTSSYDDTGESSLCTPSAEPRSRWRPFDTDRRPAVVMEITTMTADSTTFQSAWWW